MTPHYCPVEKSSMMISGCCNWCGAKEHERVIVVSDRLAWVTWAFFAVVVFSLMLGLAYVIGQMI